MSLTIDLKWLREFGVWPVLLSSPLTEAQKGALVSFGMKNYDFNLNPEEQLGLWRSQFLSSSKDANCRYLWAGRGGYGASRLASLLSLGEIDAFFRGKVFIGYSDLTAIHQIYARRHWPSIHGAVLSDMLQKNKDKNNINDIKMLCEKGLSNYSVGHWKRLNKKSYFDDLSGQLTGGNLSLLQCSIGTNWFALNQYEYLFLEDVNVKPYEVDRMLWHLYQAEALNNKRALFIGDIGSEYHELDNIFLSWSKRLKIDIFINRDFGHSVRNKPLIFHKNFSIVREDQDVFSMLFQ